MCPAAPVTKSAPSHGAQNAAVSSPPASALIASSAGLRFGSTGARFIQAKFTPRKAIRKHEVSGQWSERKSLPDTHTKQTASWTKDRLQRCAACQLKWWIDFCPVSRHSLPVQTVQAWKAATLGLVDLVRSAAVRRFPLSLGPSLCAASPYPVSTLTRSATSLDRTDYED